MNDRFVHYKVGLEAIDGEHLKLMNMMYECRNCDSLDLPRELNKLLSYMKEHFQHEDDFMDDNAYPYAKFHKAEHERLIGEVESSLRTVPNLTKFNLSDIYDMLETVLMAHIDHYDMMIGEYFKTHTNLIVRKY